MNEPIAAAGLDDVDKALDREVEQIAQRFPDTDPEKINEQVHQRYEELESTATVKAHLVTITGANVASDLVDSGETFRSPQH